MHCSLLGTLLSCALLFTNVLDASENADGSSAQFSGQIKPPGRYRFQIVPLGGGLHPPESNSLFYETDKNGKFSVDLTNVHKAMLHSEIHIRPAEADKDDQRRNPRIVKRILREPFSEEKTYQLFYGASHPIEKNSGKKWLLKGYISNAPTFLGRAEPREGDHAHPIRVRITRQSICAHLQTIESGHGHIRVDREWWRRLFRPGMPFQVDLGQMVRDAGCPGVDEEEIGHGIEELEVGFDANRSEALNWEEGHGPAHYRIRYPVLSGADARGNKFNFHYEFSFFRQTGAVRRVQLQGTGPKHLLAAWNGLMEQLNAQELVTGKVEEHAVDQQSAPQQFDEAKLQEDLDGIEREARKNDALELIEEENDAEGGDRLLTEVEMEDIVEDALERQTYSITERKEENAFGAFTLTLVRKVCSSLLNTGLAIVAEPICNAMLKHCEACAMAKRHRETIKRHEEAIRKEMAVLVTDSESWLGRMEGARKNSLSWLLDVMRAVRNQVMGVPHTFGQLAQKVLEFVKQLFRLNKQREREQEAETGEAHENELHSKRKKRGADGRGRYGGGTRAATFTGREVESDNGQSDSRNCRTIGQILRICDRPESDKSSSSELDGEGHRQDYEKMVAQEKMAKRTMRKVIKVAEHRDGWNVFKDSVELSSKRFGRGATKFLVGNARKVVGVTVLAAAVSIVVDWLLNTRSVYRTISVDGFTKQFSHTVTDSYWAHRFFTITTKDSSGNSHTTYIPYDAQANTQHTYTKDEQVDYAHEEHVAENQVDAKFWHWVIVTAAVAIAIIGVVAAVNIFVCAVH